MGKFVCVQAGTPEEERLFESMRESNRSLEGQIIEAVKTDDTGAHITSLVLSNGWEIYLHGEWSMVRHRQRIH